MDPYSSTSSMVVAFELIVNANLFQTYVHLTDGATNLVVDY